MRRKFVIVILLGSKNFKSASQHYLILKFENEIKMENGDQADQVSHLKNGKNGTNLYMYEIRAPN